MIMKIYYSDIFAEKVAEQDEKVKKVLKKKLMLLINNPRHPSLRVKKIQGQKNILKPALL